MANNKEISIVLPVYNESETLIRNVESISSIFEKINVDYEIICVDDCSVNNTWSLLVEYAKKNNTLKILQNKKNLGKGRTVQNGVLNAIGEYVIFTDADMAYDGDSLLAVYNKLKNEDVPFVSANRRDQKTKFLIDHEMFKYVYRRHQLSGLFNNLVRFMFDLKSYDTQSGLKGFHLTSAKKIFSNLTVYDFAFDVEIFILAKLFSIESASIPCVVHYPHEPSTVRIVGDSISMLLTLIKLKIKYFNLSEKL